jgi:hypothetical protein
VAQCQEAISQALFARCHRERSRNVANTLSKHRCSREEGRQAGLTQIDLCKVTLKESDQVYYLIPNNVNYQDIEHEIKEANVRNHLKLLVDTMPPTKKKQSAGLVGNFGNAIPRVDERKRASPTERSFEILCRDVEKPHKYAH